MAYSPFFMDSNPTYLAIQSTESVTAALNDTLASANATVATATALGASLPAAFSSYFQTWFNSLPTTLPSTTGQFWNNSGTLAQT